MCKISLPLAHRLTAAKRGYSFSIVLTSDTTSTLIELPWKSSLTYSSTRGAAILSGSDPPISLPAILCHEHINTMKLYKALFANGVNFTFRSPMPRQAYELTLQPDSPNQEFRLYLLSQECILEFPTAI
jgi:hypothetical protein